MWSLPVILSLPFSLPAATPCGDGFTYYFFNLEPFDCHPADDRRAMLLRAAKLHVVSGVPQADIMAAFHLSRPTDGTRHLESAKTPFSIARRPRPNTPIRFHGAADPG